MKIVRKEEKAILTATEKAILEKAFDIMDEITDKAESDGFLYDNALNVYNALEDFLDNKENYEVEPPAENVSKIVVEITL
jgi:hypothetical protein